MTPTPNPPAPDAEGPEVIPLSLLNDYLYCPRRAALKLVEGWRGANVHTERGDIVHEHSDLPGYEVVKGVTLLRALPVWSGRLGLSGKCDIVEVQSPRSKVQSLGAEVQGGGGTVFGPAEAVAANWRLPHLEAGGGRAVFCPVEFKVGKRRRWENDDAQLCAQALCLEEMFGVAVPRGAIFHAESKRRREVEFTPELRRLTEGAVAALHALLEPQPAAVDPQVPPASAANASLPLPQAQPAAANPRLPPAVFKPACEECSLYGICLPKITSEPERLARAAARLYET